MRRSCKKRWDWEVFHIRSVLFFVFIFYYLLVSTITSCLAHVINLATQALLGTYSKAKHFDPEDEATHDVDVTGYIRDEVGLIRGITVKVSTVRVVRIHYILLML